MEVDPEEEVEECLEEEVGLHLGVLYSYDSAKNHSRENLFHKCHISFYDSVVW